jgi:hypothetical protein
LFKIYKNIFNRGKRKELEGKISQFQKLDFGGKENVDQKFDELIELLNNSNIDSDQAQRYSKKLEYIISEKKLKKKFEPFNEIVNDESLSRDRMLNEFEFLLASSDLDSNDAYRVVRTDRIKALTLIVLGLLLIVLGLGMIIIPAPPYFEMFTIFYFTKDDGITLMDLIASIVAVSGFFITINGFKGFKTVF